MARTYYVIICFILVLSFSSCGLWQSAPVKGEKEIDVCFAWRDCMYRNKDNPDKSTCKDLLKACINRETFIFCTEDKNRPDRVDFQSCWDKLK